MDSGNAGQAIDSLRGELAQVGEAARMLSRQLTTLRNQVGPLEVALIRQLIEKQRESLALRAGAHSAFRDKRRLGIGLGRAAVGAILAGATTNDGYSALNAGVSGFRGALLRFGTSEWAVSLDSDVRVVPRNQISAGRNWVKLETLLQGLQRLNGSGPNGGDCFSSIADVISRIRQTPGLTYLVPPTSA